MAKASGGRYTLSFATLRVDGRPERISAEVHPLKLRDAPPAPPLELEPIEATFTPHWTPEM